MNNNDTLPRDMIWACSRNIPKKVAYIDGDRVVTWEDIVQKSQGVAQAFYNLGIRKGDTVAILSTEHLEAIEVLFACFMMGAIRVAINPRFSSREILHVIHDSEAKLLLVDSACLTGLINGEGAHDLVIDDAEIMVMSYGENHGLPLDYEGQVLTASNYGEAAVWPDLSSDDIAMITYTSGTTGLPKGVVLSNKAISEAIINTLVLFGYQSDDIYFAATASAWVTVLLTIMNIGNGMGCVLANGHFELLRFCEMVDKYNVTTTILPPVLLSRLIGVLKDQPFSLSSLRLIGYGSSPATPGLIKKAMEAFPRARLFQAYGLSEAAGGWVSYLSHNDHLRALTDCPNLLLSAGRPSLRFRVSVRRTDGTEADIGETGEVWIQSPTVMMKYWHLPELTDSTLRMTNEGLWLKTHDVGHLDVEGFLYLTDRAEFLIISGAINIFPHVVENVLSDHPAVNEVAVVGAPHPEWGEAVVAVVNLVPEQHATMEDLLAFCDGKLARFEKPKFIEFLDDIPKGVTGKILKKNLIDRYRTNPHLLPW